MTRKSESELNDDLNKKKELEQIIELTKLGIRLKCEKDFNIIIDYWRE